MTHDFYKFWLKMTAVIVGSFGPVFFLATLEFATEPARWTLDLLSWPLDQAQSYADPTTRFLSALTGGFLMGWGVLIWCLSTNVYDAAPEGIRKSVLISLLSWFVLDTAGSIASGNASNALFNVIVLIVAVGPLWRPAKS